MHFAVHQIDLWFCFHRLPRGRAALFVKALNYWRDIGSWPTATDATQRPNNSLPEFKVIAVNQFAFVEHSRLFVDFGVYHSRCSSMLLFSRNGTRCPNAVHVLFRVTSSCFVLFYFILSALTCGCSSICTRFIELLWIISQTFIRIFLNFAH